MVSRAYRAIGVLTACLLVAVVAMGFLLRNPNGIPEAQSPSPDAIGTSFSFVATGDFGAPGNGDMVALAKRAGAAHATFLLALGDLGYVADESGWCSSIKGGFDDVELIAGNHDAGENSGGNISVFVQYCPFTLNVNVTAGPATPGYGYEYYFDYPASSPLARFIFIAAGVRGFLNYDYSPGSTHYNWVVNAVNDARSSGIPWVFVASHKLCINAGTYGCEIGQALFDKLVDLKVDVFLQAHYHTYQRSKQLALSANCPSVLSNGQFDADCIVDDGADGNYSKGAGSVVVVSGSGGRSLYTIPFDGSDPEINYMVEAMGSNGNTENLTAGYGGVLYTVSRTSVVAKTDLCPAGGADSTGHCPNDIDSTFHDAFTIGSAPEGPVARFTHVPLWPSANESVAFNASSSSDSDPNATLQARWDWEGDGVWDTPWSSSLTSSHVFAIAGTYPVAIEVLDSNGLGDATNLAVVVSNGVGGGVGAPPGYGLLDPSRLQSRGPIYIGANADFTAANGVRRGSGTAADPYVISDWFIDGNTYPNTGAIVQVENTDKYAVIENVEITNLTGANQWAAIQLGEFPAIVTTANVIIRHNLVLSGHAYGVYVNEGSSNVRVEANEVHLDGNRDWVYGAVTMRGTHNITFYGNYVNAYTSASYLTVGIHLSDYYVGDDRQATQIVAERNTVMNATAGGIVSESSVGTVVRDNLVFQDYPGMKSVAPDYPRGIMTEWSSNATAVSGNVIHTYHWGIQVGSDRGVFFSNTVYDVDYGVFVLDNGSWPGINTYDETIYNTTYSSVSQQPFRLPSKPDLTVVDVGPGVVPGDLRAVLVKTYGSPTVMNYSWSGSRLNVSMTLGGSVIYDITDTVDSETLYATWAGTLDRLVVTSFLPGQLSFDLQSGAAVAFTGVGFAPNTSFDLLRGSTVVLTQTSTPAGGLAFVIPAAVPSSYTVQPSSQDTTPPITTFSSSGTGGTANWYRSPVSVTLNATDSGSGVASITFRIDGGSWQTYTSPVTVQGDGTHTVEYYATDNAGNQEAARTATLKIDTTAPSTSASVGGTLAGDGSYVGSANITLTAVDATSGVQSIEYRVDGGAWWTYATTFPVGGNGTHTVEYAATDNAGNPETTESLTVRISGGSHGPPVTTLAAAGSPGRNGWYVSEVTVSLSALSEASGPTTIAYRLDGDTWDVYAGPITIPEGRHVFDYQATDADGIQEPLKTAAINVDYTPPSFIALSPGGLVTSADVPVAWTVSDPMSGVDHYDVSVDGGAFMSVGRNTTLQRSWSDGDHQVVILAVDAAGNQATATLSFRVDTNPLGFVPLQGFSCYLLPLLGVVLLALAVLLRRRHRRPGSESVEPEPFDDSEAFEEPESSGPDDSSEL